MVEFFFVHSLVSDKVLNHSFVPSQIVRFDFRIAILVVSDPRHHYGFWLLLTLLLRLIMLNLLNSLLAGLHLQLLSQFDSFFQGETHLLQNRVLTHQNLDTAADFIFSADEALLLKIVV